MSIQPSKIAYEPPLTRATSPQYSRTRVAREAHKASQWAEVTFGAESGRPPKVSVAEVYQRAPQPIRVSARSKLGERDSTPSARHQDVVLDAHADVAVAVQARARW